MVKLLVADDEQKICRLLETFFVDRGFEVVVAHDGKTALERIHQHRPHVVFLDLHMPGMDGMAVLETLRNTPAYKDVAVMVMTSDTMTGQLNKAFGLGIKGYIVKPPSIENLLGKVKAFLTQNS